MKNISNTIFRVFSFAFAITLSVGTYAQEYLKQSNTAEINLSPSGGSNIDVSFPNNSIKGSGVDYNIHSAYAILHIDMHKNNTEYLVDENSSFSYSASFSIQILNSRGEEIGSLSNVTHTIGINNSEPVKEIRFNLAEIAEDQSTIKTIDKIVIIDPMLTIFNGSNQTELRCYASIEVEYEVGVTINGSPIISVTQNQVTVDQLTATFEWESFSPFTMYQLQLLRLYNNDSDYLTEQNISTEVDWNKAITIDVAIQNPIDENGNLIQTHSHSLTVAQGTGFYVWRIRPIGTYFEGGVGNYKNYGNWSFSFSGTIELDKSSVESPYFYVIDPDEDINRIYSRVYTEESKVKEISTYANTLNQVKQTKTYIPSNNVTIISQTISDYAGRAALTTLPAPVVSKIDSYVENFATTDDNEIYSAENLQGESHADFMNEDRELGYYNENNDPRIPNSRGVPFTQSTYYDDPLNRIKEQGAPGELHMINNYGSGKTTKYYYGTPSKTELVELFGADAPSNETVSKMVQVDPNNIATVTYTSAEGSVLATSMVFIDSENSSLVNLEDQDPERDLVTDVITKSIPMEWGFLSTKRIILMQDNTPFDLSYTIKKETLTQGCTQLNIDCNYTLDISIHNVETGAEIIVFEDLPLSDCETIEINGEPYIYVPWEQEQTLNAGTYVIEKKLKFGVPTSSTQEVTNALSQQVQPMVNLITKHLEAIGCEEMVDQFQVWLKDISQDFGDESFISYINSNEEEISTELEYYLQYTYPAHLANNDDISLSLYTYNGTTYVQTMENEKAELVVLSTPCCSLPFSVKWIESFNTNRKPSITGDPSDPVFVPDFEAYAEDFFLDCDELNGRKFYKYMQGWYDEDKGIPRGTFNLMVYHMLTDDLYQYTENEYLKEKIESGIFTTKPTPSEEVNECGDPIENTWYNGVYSTKDLFNCWKNQLSSLKGKVCSGIEWESGSPLSEVDLDESIDTQNDGDKEVLNQHLRKILDDVPWWRRRKVRKAIEQIVRDESDKIPSNYEDENNEVPIETNIVKDFLDCTGYTYVKILTPYDPDPLIEDRAPDLEIKYNFEVPNTFFTKPFKFRLSSEETADYFSNPAFKKGEYDYYYFPLNDWEPQLNEQSIFPNIKNPIYAFKYFEYPQEGHDDYQNIEYMTCYSDPNDCFDLDDEGFIEQDEDGGILYYPCCATGYGTFNQCYEDTEYPNLDEINDVDDPRYVYEGENIIAKRIVKEFDNGSRYKCPYDHYAWSSGQRYTFYSLLKDYERVSLDYTEDDISCSSYKNNEDWYYNIENPSKILSYDEIYEDDNEDFSDYEVLSVIPDPEGGYTNEFNYIQLEMYLLTSKCQSTCIERKDGIREMLNELFVQNCYNIDGCMSNAEGYENVIPSSAIEELVEKMVESCTQQCALNTYGCSDKLARKIETPRRELGYNITIPKMVLGIGGFPEGEIAGVTTDYYTFEQNNAIPETFYTAENLQVIGYTLSDDDPQNSMYSWYQYTMINQASEWNLEVNVPSMCDSYTLQAETATSVSGVIKTTAGVENFGENDMIAFEGIDFGLGTLTVSVKYSLIDPQDNEKQVSIYIDNGSGVETLAGTATLTYTGASYNEVTFDMEPSVVGENGIQGIGNLYLRGWSESSPGLVKVDLLRLNAAEGDYSHIRGFTQEQGPSETSTYMQRSEYEKETHEIQDANLPAGASTVTSPAKAIIQTIDQSRK